MTPIKINKQNIATLMLCCTSLYACNTAQEKEKAQTPNVIYILADDLGYGDIEPYGQEIIKSNDAELQDEILKSMLIDGIGWLEIQIIDDKPTITPLKIGEVSEIVSISIDSS